MALPNLFVNCVLLTASLHTVRLFPEFGNSAKNAGAILALFFVSFYIKRFYFFVKPFYNIDVSNQRKGETICVY